MNYNNNTFQWAIDESLWEDKNFLIEKFSNIRSGMYKGNTNSNLCEKMKLINPENWKDEDFVNQMIKANSEVLYSLFVLSPIFEDIESQIELEKTLLKNINEDSIKDFSYMWNSYLKYNYLYYHRNEEFMTYIGENEYQFYSDDRDRGFFNLFYNHEQGVIQENKEKYKVIIEFLEQNILSKKIINTINNPTFGEDEYNKYILQNLQQGSHKLDGEVYIYLPEELKSNNYLIESYIEWTEDILNKPFVTETHNRPRSMEVLSKPKKYQCNIYVDYNAVPLEYFNDDKELKKMTSYLKNLVLNPIDKKVNNKLSLSKKSTIIRQWLSQDITALDLLKCVIAIRSDQIGVIWEKFIPKSMKETKQFVLDFLNIESDKKIMFLPSAKNDIFKILPERFKQDKDIQLAYLKHDGSLNNITKFPLYELDDIKDHDLIKKVIANNMTIFMGNYLKVETDLQYKEKTLNKINEWRTNIDFLCAYTQNLSYINLTENEWRIILSQNNAVDKLLSVNNFNNFISHLPSSLHTEEIILKSLKAYKNISMSLKIEDKHFQNPEFCHEVLKCSTSYITQIPDELWDNKPFFIKVFESIDNKEIGKDILKELPIRIKQFLEMYDINDNYSKSLTTLVLRDKLSKTLETKIDNHKKRKI